MIGETLICSMRDAVNRQSLINEQIDKSDLGKQTKIDANDQLELLVALLKLCERVY
tara:strand:+ start:1551 stop:1718 length:168 start_codon:yes stop_codon:yes gene_type:complete